MIYVGRGGSSPGALRQALEQHPIRCLLVTPNFSNPQGLCRLAHSLLSE